MTLCPSRFLHFFSYGIDLRFFFIGFLVIPRRGLPMPMVGRWYVSRFLFWRNGHESPENVGAGMACFVAGVHSRTRARAYRGGALHRRWPGPLHLARIPVRRGVDRYRRAGFRAPRLFARLPGRFFWPA